MKRALVLLLACIAVTGCVTTRGNLWNEAATPPRLEDASLVMTTTWETGGKPSIEKRSVIVANGLLTVSVDSYVGRREGTATTDAWSKLWTTLDAIAPWQNRIAKPDDRDPQGGPYHHVAARVGRYYNEWSAQSGGGIFGIQTQRSADRIKMTNAIYDFIEAHATHETRKGPASKPAP